MVEEDDVKVKGGKVADGAASGTVSDGGSADGGASAGADDGGGAKVFGGGADVYGFGTRGERDEQWRRDRVAEHGAGGASGAGGVEAPGVFYDSSSVGAPVNPRSGREVVERGGVAVANGVPGVRGLDDVNREFEERQRAEEGPEVATRGGSDWDPAAAAMFGKDETLIAGDAPEPVYEPEQGQVQGKSKKSKGEVQGQGKGQAQGQAQAQGQGNGSAGKGDKKVESYKAVQKRLEDEQDKWLSGRREERRKATEDYLKGLEERRKADEEELGRAHDEGTRMYREWLAKHPEESEEEREARERRERSRRIVSAVGDGVRAISNLVFTTQYAPDAYRQGSSMLQRTDDGIAAGDKVREGDDNRRMNYALKIGQGAKDKVGALQKLRDAYEAARARRVKADADADKADVTAGARKVEKGVADYFKDEDLKVKRQNAESSRIRANKTGTGGSRKTGGSGGGQNKTLWTGYDEKGNAVQFYAKNEAHAKNIADAMGLTFSGYDTKRNEGKTTYVPRTAGGKAMKQQVKKKTGVNWK